MAMLVDPLLSQLISKLSEAVIYVAQTTTDFKTELWELQHTLGRIHLEVSRMVGLNQVLNQTQSNTFVHDIQDAEMLVRKCLEIKPYSFKRFTYSRKLKDVNKKLLRFFQIEYQPEQIRDSMETLVVASEINEKVSELSRGSLPMSSSMKHVGPEMIVREKLGWRVPRLHRGIVSFEKQLEMLKAKVLADDDGDSMARNKGSDDGSVQVVSAMAGSGKTTFVTMLCHDPTQP